MEKLYMKWIHTTPKCVNSLAMLNTYGNLYHNRPTPICDIGQSDTVDAGVCTGDWGAWMIYTVSQKNASTLKRYSSKL